MAPSSLLKCTFCRVLLNSMAFSAVDIIQSFLRVIIHVRFHYLFKPINIPCHGLFILLIVSNFTKDPPRGSVHFCHSPLTN